MEAFNRYGDRHFSNLKNRFPKYDFNKYKFVRHWRWSLHQFIYRQKVAAGFLPKGELDSIRWNRKEIASTSPIPHFLENAQNQQNAEITAFWISSEKRFEPQQKKMLQAAIEDINLRQAVVNSPLYDNLLLMFLDGQRAENSIQFETAVTSEPSAFASLESSVSSVFLEICKSCGRAGPTTKPRHSHRKGKASIGFLPDQHAENEAILITVVVVVCVAVAIALMQIDPNRAKSLLLVCMEKVKQITHPC